MNTFVFGAIPRTIMGTTKFESLTVAENGIVLKYEKNKVNEISFSELDKIYIKVYKLKPIYGILFILLPMLFAFLCFEFIKFNIEISVALLPIIPALVNVHRFKRFDLVIVLKGGSIYRKQISLKLKSDTVEVINQVKKKCLYYTTSLTHQSQCKELDLLALSA